MQSVIQEIATIQNHLNFLDKNIPEVQLGISNTKDKKIYAQKKNNILDEVQNFREQVEE